MSELSGTERADALWEADGDWLGHVALTVDLHPVMRLSPLRH